MNREEKHLARIMFKIKILAADGQAYEDLFTSVMEIDNKDFVQIKPQGRIGDRKNDGYDRKVGRYYQVFAPQDPLSKAQDAAKKLKEDFDGLYKHWNKVTPVTEFHFVFNDKYKGVFPTIEADLAAIKRSKKLAECSSFLAKHLEQAFLDLKDEHIFSILGGYIPAPDKIGTLDYSVLKEVIDYVMRAEAHLDAQQIVGAPEFEAKMKFNELGSATSALLVSGSYQAGILERYFELNSDFAKQDLRDRLAGFYAEAKDARAGIAGTADAPDLIFFDILYRIAPSRRQAEVNAGLVIMAYFFESCDIYDAPVSA